MTEVTTYQAPVQLSPTPQASAQPAAEILPATTPSQGLSELAQWAQETDAAAYIAGMLAKTAFVPREFQGNQANVTAAILEGKSLGMNPMKALKSIYVVHGRPGMYAKAMLEMIIAAGHQLYPIERTEQRVTLRAVRKGETEGIDYTWTIERATRAGYTTNAKYKTNPTEMLHWKAISEAAKFTFPDVIGGMDSIEDIEDGDFDSTASPTVAEAKAVTAGAKKVQRKATAAQKAAAVEPPAPATPPVIDESPEPDTETEEVIEPQAEVKYISKTDQARISAGLDDLGVTDRTAKLEIVRDWSGIASLKGVNGLTHEQAQHILARIEDEKQKMFG